MNTKQFATIDEYIEVFPEKAQAILRKVRHTIIKAAPKATEGISYKMPAFKLNGKGLVYFAAWQKHLGFYALPSGTAFFLKRPG